MGSCSASLLRNGRARGNRAVSAPRFTVAELAAEGDAPAVQVPDRGYAARDLPCGDAAKEERAHDRLRSGVPARSGGIRAGVRMSDPELARIVHSPAERGVVGRDAARLTRSRANRAEAMAPGDDHGTRPSRQHAAAEHSGWPVRIARILYVAPAVAGAVDGHAA